MAQETRVVALSRAMAASGEEIAQAVAQTLGYRYVDNDIIDRAAEQAGVSPQTIEQVEHSRPLIARILDSMATSAFITAGAWPEPGLAAFTPTASYHRLIEQVIHDTAEEGNVVIVAHAASIPLAGTAGVLRVLVTGSQDVRAARYAAHAKLDHGAALKAINESDRERAAYLRRFYRLEQELPTHYDLVVNTDVLSPSKVADLIVAAARGE
ncbi:MAG: cytidylate kinase-like family protein [Chloroflexi bacterium]|nr:cytidylate kinase-like family protein [Chloroflexota bacterium]